MPDPNVFFVCGAPKSGTTWLQRVLDAHPEVCCAGEGHFLDRFTTPLAQVLNAYNAQLSLETQEVYEGKPYYQPVEQAEFDALARSFIMGRLASRAGPEARWVGDKTPRYTHQLNQLHRLFPEARFFHIVRDPRDVAVSRMGHHLRTGLADAFTPGAEGHRVSVELAVNGWIEAVTLVNGFAEAHPGLVHEVRYNDLHDDPVGAAKALFAFLGVATGRALIEQVVAATSFEALAGRKPGEEDPASFFRKGVPDDWKTRLPAEAAEAIVEACGELMRQKRFVA